MDDYPIIELPGSADWRGSYEQGEALAAAFPGQDADEFIMACNYNDWGPLPGRSLRELTMLEEGERDRADWRWRAILDDGSTWEATGGCDYTGWDCRSFLTWERVG